MIPIIFVREHCPQSGYSGTPLVIQNARKWNPNGRVVLIGDKHQPQGLCEFAKIEDYSENKRALRSIAKYSDPSNDWFIFTTLSQWCVIYEWMAENWIQEAVCLDTDVLVFADLEAEARKLHPWDFSLSCPLGTCQAPTLVSVEAVFNFTRFLFAVFNHDDGSDWQNIRPNERDSMALWSEYVRLCDPKPRVVDTSKVVDDSTWDHNLAMAYGGYEHDGKGKTMRFINGQPWCFSTTLGRPVRFNSLHLWGDFKSQVARYVQLSEDSMK